MAKLNAQYPDDETALFYFGTLLMELNHPADAREQFQQALKRTPGRPRANYGLAQAEQATQAIKGQRDVTTSNSLRSG